VRPARPALQRRRRYKLHIGCIGGGPGAGGVTGYIVAALVKDWRRRAAAPVEDRSRRTLREPAAGVNGPAAERPALGLGEPESTHRWTGTTCRAAPLACSDWSEERDAGRSRLDRVEGGGDNGKQDRAGRHPRLVAITRVLTCRWGAGYNS
jgi:hypothetical protein